jgi:hypothetical protein
MPIARTFAVYHRIIPAILHPAPKPDFLTQ